MTRTMRLAAAMAVIGLSIADIASTALALDRGAIETNPLMLFTQEHFGGSWYLTKIGVTLVVAYLIISLQQRWVSASGIVAITFFAVVFPTINIFQLVTQ